MWCSRAGYRSIGYQSNSPGPQGVQGAAAGRDRLSRLVGLSRIHVEVPPLARGPRGVMGPPGGDTHLKGHQQGGELKTSRGRVGRNTSATTKMLNQDDRTSIGAREEHGAALAADAPSKYERSPGGSWADVFEPADPLVAAAVLGHARDGDCRAAPAGSILRRCLRAQAAQPLRCTARPTLLIAKPGYPYRSAAWSSGQQVNRSTGQQVNASHVWRESARCNKTPDRLQRRSISRTIAKCGAGAGRYAPRANGRAAASHHRAAW